MSRSAPHDNQGIGKSIELVAPAERVGRTVVTCPTLMLTLVCGLVMPQFRQLASTGKPMKSKASDRSVRPTLAVVPQPASFAANASTRIPATIRYTAKGTNPCFRTQAMNHATDA